LPDGPQRLRDAVDGMASSCAQRQQFLDELLFGGVLSDTQEARAEVRACEESAAHNDRH
jgi:hypothetical protein